MYCVQMAILWVSQFLSHPVCFMQFSLLSAPSATRADESNSKLPRFRRACEIGSFLSLPNWSWLVVRDREHSELLLKGTPMERPP